MTPKPRAAPAQISTPSQPWSGATPINHGLPPESDATLKRSFPKTARLLKSAQFRHVMTRGYKIVTPFFVTYTLHQPEGQVSQLGITASRKVGKAIARNRLKRLLREWFRHTRERLPHPVACVIIVRPRANQENNTTLWRTLEPVIQRSAQSGKRHRNA